MPVTTSQLRATDYEVKRLTCHLSRFAGAGNRNVAEGAYINAKRLASSMRVPSRYED